MGIRARRLPWPLKVRSRLRLRQSVESLRVVVVGGWIVQEVTVTVTLALDGDSRCDKAATGRRDSESELQLPVHHH